MKPVLPVPSIVWRVFWAVLAILTALAIATGWILGPALLELASSRLETAWISLPEETRLRASVLYLDVILDGYAIAAVIAMGMIVGGIAVGYLSRAEPRARRRRQVRLLAPGSILLASLATLDLGATIWTSERGDAPPSIQRIQWPSVAKPKGDDSIELVVVGESSARGEPYAPWLSAAQIAGWALKSVFAGRAIRVDVRARGGAMIRELDLQIKGLSRRPDALVVCVGHNEFASRFPWMRDPGNYYDDEMPTLLSPGSLRRLLRYSPACRLALLAWDRQRIHVRPPRFPTRELVDRPVFTAEESSAIREEFAARLERIVESCERAGILPILIMPVSNDVDFDPSRSVLAPPTPRAERDAFAHELELARTLEESDPDAALRLDRELVGRHPEFAEVHYRMARLLERRGDWEKARVHYAEARERDGMPVRIRNDLRQIYRDVAARYPSVVLVDSPLLLERADPHGLPGDRFFHDAQHPNLRGYVEQARDLVEQLRERRAFGWPNDVGPPKIDVESCARHFGLDRARWSEICRREAAFYGAVAFIRHDPEFRLAREADYLWARQQIESGIAPASAGIPGWPIDAPTSPAAVTSPDHPSPADSPHPRETTSKTGSGPA